MLRSLIKSLQARPEATPAPPVQLVAPAAPSPAGFEVLHRAGARAQAALAQGTPAEAVARARERLAQGEDLDTLLELAVLLEPDAAEAGAFYARAASLYPAAAPLQFALGMALQRQLRIAEATAAMRLALAAAPEEATYRLALALLLFLDGQYREGFLHFRARNDPAKQVRKDPWLAHLPAWQGEELEGKRLLVWTDWGGLGDELLFARYIGLVAQRLRPAELHVRCTGQMRRLLAGIEGVTSAFDQASVLNADCHTPLLDLPCVFGTDLDSIPAPAPYLRPGPADAARWKARLEPMRGLKVGLCWGSGFWSGGTEKDGARLNKSMSLKQLAPLCDITGVTLVSLQKGGALPELAALGLPVHDFDADLRDMADTAALAANLDLVITVDTSVSHLAGALGLPTLVLLPYGSGSFWLLNTERSPWYPSVRLLRHAREGDWAGVAARAEALLRVWAADGRVDLFA